MNKVLDMIPALVTRELAAANDEFPPFHSLHEGWAVLKEEIEETHEALDCVVHHLDNMWTYVREDNAAATGDKARWVIKHATVVAAEAIQVAAMAQKMLDYINSEEAKAHDKY